jgi:hypothetical protein
VDVVVPAVVDVVVAAVVDVVVVPDVVVVVLYGVQLAPTGPFRPQTKPGIW